MLGDRQAAVQARIAQSRARQDDLVGEYGRSFFDDDLPPAA